MKRPMLFVIEGELSEVELYSEDFPLKQTQALLITLDEIDVWVSHAKDHFGGDSLRSLAEHKNWLSIVENYVLEVRDVLDYGYDGDEDDDIELRRVIACRLNADDPLVESLEAVFSDFPDDDDISEHQKGKAVAQTLISLTRFWMDQIHQLLQRLLSIITGDGEVMTILKRHELLEKFSF
jgi:hypothetical protein